MLNVLAMLALLAAFVIACGILGSVHEGSRGRGWWDGFVSGCLGGSFLLVLASVVGVSVMAIAWAMEHLFGGGAC